MFGKKQKIIPDRKLTKVRIISSPTLPETPWKSIVTVSIFTFCTAVQFTMYFSSLWPFLQIIDSSATEMFYGVIIAAYSLGQILSGPVTGWWATKTRSIVGPATFCLILTLIGNIIYITASLLSSHQKWCVLVGRFIVGMGESGLSLYQSYASTASTHQDRSKALSITTGGLALGFSIGPAIQLIFTPLEYPGFHIAGKLQINMYTAPAVTCCVVNIISIVVLHTLFVEQYSGIANQDDNDPTKKVHVPKYDRVAVGLCHMTRFVQLFVFTNLETIGTPFVMAIFALNSADTVKSLSICHSIAGFLGFACYMVHASRNSEIVDFRKLLIFGFGGLLAYHFLTIPLPFSAGELKTYTAEAFEAYKQANYTGIEPVGCPETTFAWCNTTGTVNFWVFMASMTAVLGIFWPNVNVALSTLLSKILGPRRQANQQSMFQMSASCARLIGPILISNVYTIGGPMYTWIVEIGILVFIIIVWMVAYKRMVPLKMPEPGQSIPPELEESSDLEVEEEDKDAHNFARF